MHYIQTIYVYVSMANFFGTNGFLGRSKLTVDQKGFRSDFYILDLGSCIGLKNLVLLAAMLTGTHIFHLDSPLRVNLL